MKGFTHTNNKFNHLLVMTSGLENLHIKISDLVGLDKFP